MDVVLSGVEVYGVCVPLVPSPLDSGFRRNDGGCAG